MRIEKLKKKKDGMYDLILENNIKIILHEDTILKNNLLITKNIDDNMMDKVLNESNQSYVYGSCIKYISYKMRSKKEVKEYLKKKDINIKLIDNIISRLEKEGYINDIKYAELYINDQLNLSNNGPLKIKNNLLMLGIDENTVDEKLNNINIIEIEEKLKKLIYKKIKLVNGSKKEIKRKILSYFYNLGYDNSMISNILDSIDIRTDIEKLKKEYNLLYRKYKNKYDKNNVNYIIKNKLLLKGYTNDEIDGLNI